MTTELLIDDIIRREGGVADRPADRGGITHWGITAHTLGHWMKLGRPATRDEVLALTYGDARQIYRDLYVTPFSWAPDPLRALMVDWSVTSGPSDPIHALQVTLKRRGLYAGLLDGVVGSLTRAAVVNDNAPRETYRDVLLSRIRFYQALGITNDADVQAFLASHPHTQLANVAGWVNRSLEFVLG